MRRARHVGWTFCVVAMLASPALAQTYSYDALGRLVLISPDASTSWRFNYDPAGNRTSVVPGSVQPPPRAVRDVYTVQVGGPPQNLDPRPNDVAPGVTIVGVSPVEYGQAALVGGLVQYTPPASGGGGRADVFAYTIQTSTGLTASAQIRVNLQ